MRRAIVVANSPDAVVRNPLSGSVLADAARFAPAPGDRGPAMGGRSQQSSRRASRCLDSLSLRSTMCWALPKCAVQHGRRAPLANADARLDALPAAQPRRMLHCPCTGLPRVAMEGARATLRTTGLPGVLAHLHGRSVFLGRWVRRRAPLRRARTHYTLPHGLPADHGLADWCQHRAMTRARCTTAKDYPSWSPFNRSIPPCLRRTMVSMAV